MRKLLSLFTALLFVGTMWGQAAAGTTLFSENFGGYSNSDVPSGVVSAATNYRVIYGNNATVTYTCTKGAGTKPGSTYVTTANDGNLAGGTSPELMVGKKGTGSGAAGGSFSIAGIPSGGAQAITVVYKQNAQNLSVSVSGTGYSTTYTGGKPSEAGERTFDITVANGAAATFTLTFQAATTSNVRVDDIVIKVKTAGVSPDPTVSFAQPTGGTLALSVAGSAIESGAEVAETTEVTITATPGEGYKLPATITFKDGENQDVDPDDLTFIENDDKNGGAFLMPDYDLTVAAAFTEKTQPTNEQFAWTAASASVEKGGDSNVFPSLTNTLSLAVTYESSDTDIATIAANGNITLKAAGETQIRAIFAGDGDYLPKTVYYTLTVTVDCSKTATVTKTAPVNGSFNVSAESVCADGEGGFVTISNITPAAGYMLDEVNATVGTYDANTGKVTGITDNTTITVTFKLIPTYTAKWYVNGVEQEGDRQTAVAGTDLVIPSNPTKLADDCSDMVFRGWASAPIVGSQVDAPAYANLEGIKMAAHDTAFYAVFAEANEEVVDGDTEWVATAITSLATNDSIVIVGNNGNNYAMSNNNGASNPPSAVAVSITTGKLSAEPVATIKWKFVKNSDNNYSFYVGDSYLYCTNTNNGVRVGSGDAKEFSIESDYLYEEQTEKARYLGIYNSGDWRCYETINANIKDQTFAFFKKTISKDTITTYANFMTTCLVCTKVKLSAASVEHGSIALSKDSVKTCEAAEVTVTPSPASGYELTNIALSGVAGTTYSEGVISIPADAEGTLTVTATFSAINYTVAMAQTGEAGSTISANQTNKHVGDNISISATAVDGYYFLGWEANVEVTFANAKALETTFSMPASNVTVTAKFAKILSVAEAITAIDNAGKTTIQNQVVLGYICRIESTSEYYIKDLDANGFLTGTEFEVYSGKGLNNVAFESVDDLEIGAKALIFGNITYYAKNSVYEFAKDNYLLDYDAGSYEGVEIYGEATKTAYEVGDAFVTTGLHAKDVWDNGYAQTIETPTWIVSPATIAANTVSVSVTAKNAEEDTSNPVVVAVTLLTHELTYTAAYEHGSVDVKYLGETVDSGDHFVKGDKLTITATPESAKYKLASLTVNGDVFTSGNTYTVDTDDIVVVAVFSVATSLEDVETSVKAVKVLRNGILLIEKNGRTYNAMGQLVK